MAETIHESRSLRQARPDGQGVDLPHKRNDLCKLLPQAGISSDGKIITLMKRFLQIAGGVSGRNDGKMRGSVRNRGEWRVLHAGCPVFSGRICRYPETGPVCPARAGENAFSGPSAAEMKRPGDRTKGGRGKSGNRKTERRYGRGPVRCHGRMTFPFSGMDAGLSPVFSG